MSFRSDYDLPTSYCLLPSLHTQGLSRYSEWTDVDTPKGPLGLSDPSESIHNLPEKRWLLSVDGISCLHLLGIVGLERIQSDLDALSHECRLVKFL